jgi:multimeric flavodoxin WrbA
MKKIVIINGTQRHGSTYHVIHQLIDKLDPQLDVKVTEFFLPKAMPHFCMGCYNCINRGEQYCPHRDDVEPLRLAMGEADLIIVGSPVYVFDVSGQLKAMFDHFGYQWMSHRPVVKMFSTIGLSVVTGAGAGMKATARTIMTNFRWWGIAKRYSLNQAVMAASYQEISPKILQQLDQQTTLLARKLSIQLKRKPRPEVVTRILFKIMRMAKKGHPQWNRLDYDYWKDLGFLDGVKPWGNQL